MEKRIIKATDRVNSKGFRETVYRDGKRVKLVISHPNEFCDGYTVRGLGWCFAPKQTFAEARDRAENVLQNVYSIFGGVEFKYTGKEGEKC